MPASFSNLRSKLNRAITAYLVSVGGDCGTIANIFPANIASDKTYPNTTVRATLSQPEVQMTGIRRIRVHIEIKGQPSGDPSEADIEKARVDFDKRVSATEDAMMQTEDGETFRETARLITAAGRALATNPDATIAANDADMVDFTCQAVYDAGEGDGEPIENGPAWFEILMFDIVCSPSNVD
jgi:hypothetical protein